MRKLTTRNPRDDRWYFWEDLSELIPVIIALEGSESLPEIARAIQDVGRQWP